MSTPTTPLPGKRLLSLDALRGFDMFWILGADDVMMSLSRPDHPGFLAALARQFDHVEWAGFRFYDLIFPLFIFIVGVSLVFSLSKEIEREGLWGAHRRIFRRFLLLFAVALIYSGGVSNEWPNIRLMGVLNRIALCYLFAALIFTHCRWKTMAGITAGLLLGYWAMMAGVPFPDVRPVDAQGQLQHPEMKLHATNTAQLNFASTNRLRGIYAPGLNFANYLDQKYLPGKKWDGTWDPEGYLSTFPAIATCLLGVFAGLLLRNPAVRDQQKVFWLLGTGAAGVALGWVWHLEFPMIKKIWTSSFVLVAGGWSAILLGLFYQVIEIWGWRKWTTVLVWIGANAITLYLANNIINFHRLARRFFGGDVKNLLDTTLGKGAGELVLVLAGMGLAVLLGRFLYRRQIFLRL